MVLLQPVRHIMPELFGEIHPFSRVLLRGDTGHVVVSRVALGPTGIEVVGVIVAFRPEDQRQRCDCAMGVESFSGR